MFNDELPLLVLNREQSHLALETIDTVLAMLATVPFDADSRRVDSLKRLRRDMRKVCARNQW